MDEPKIDRRIRRTRDNLREALVSLMLEKSYAKITVQEIIDRADVGRATFYNHYQDKDDLLLRGVAELPYRQEEPRPGVSGRPAVSEAAANTPEGETFKVAHMFAHSRENERLHQVMFKRSRENPLLEKVTAFLYAQVDAQIARLVTDEHPPAVPIPVLAQFLTGGLLSLIHWWHDQNFPYPPEEMDAFFQQIVMPGTINVLKTGVRSNRI